MTPVCPRCFVSASWSLALVHNGRQTRRTLVSDCCFVQRADVAPELHARITALAESIPLPDDTPIGIHEDWTL